MLERLERVQHEQNDIQDQIALEKSGMLDATLPEIRRHVRRFKNLDYTITKNRQDLVDTFVNKIWLYNDGNAKVRYNVTDFHGGYKGSFYDRMVGTVGLEPTTSCV